jgi:hypothetical protein
LAAAGAINAQSLFKGSNFAGACWERAAYNKLIEQVPNAKRDHATAGTRAIGNIALEAKK